MTVCRNRLELMDDALDETVAVVVVLSAPTSLADDELEVEGDSCIGQVITTLSPPASMVCALFTAGALLLAWQRLAGRAMGFVVYEIDERAAVAGHSTGGAFRWCWWTAEFAVGLDSSC